MKFKNFILLAILALTFLSAKAYDGPGDTTKVNAFTYGSARDSVIIFPSDTMQWEKVLMYYRLKCDPSQSPACGEWDYLTYTYLYDSTGVMDSTLLYHANYLVGGQEVDTLEYMLNPSYNYFQSTYYSNNTTDTNTATIGIGSSQMPVQYSTQSDGRMQFLYTAAELSAAGLNIGDITKLHLWTTGGTCVFKNFTIKIKHTTQTVLNPNQPELDNFTTVYIGNVTTPPSSQFYIPLAWPFNWDANSNIIVEFSWEDYTGNFNLSADPQSVLNGIQSNFEDNYLSFELNDHIVLDASNCATIDSAITISYWMYGDPNNQPRANYNIEAYDANGKRVFNVHHPWGDGNVYWDCGNDAGSYDRIYKAADSASMYKGEWNFWTFTKNTRTGEMKIFFNGQLWHSATGRTKDMTGISQLYIATNNQQIQSYYGFMDEIRIWNIELSAADIANYMYNNVPTTHPNYSNLLYNYKFDEGSGLTTQNSANLPETAPLTGFPGWRSYNGNNRLHNWSANTNRPQIRFGQGVYNATNMQMIYVTDSMANDPIQLVFFEDLNNPTTPTDTLIVWPSYYNNFVFDANGNVLSSTKVTPDSTIYKQMNPYYDPPFEVVNRYELGRYITPYGIGLDLGDGFTWVFDVSDYVTLLHDTVRIAAGNWQELLDLSFIMIEGTPSRDVKRIENIYNGRYNYTAEVEAENLIAKKFFIETDELQAKFKVRTTGHGFGGNLNCAEFCPRTHDVHVNGTLAAQEYVWRDCNINPLVAQGGTWIYSRSNWCPGAEVQSFEVELGDYLIQNDSIEIDYSTQAGYVWNGSGSTPYYMIQGQLITYGDNNFALNPSLDEIISPSQMKLYGRYNPMCANPEIQISNQGSDSLTSLKIEYGLIGGQTLVYNWTGNLAYLQTQQITLPPIDWTNWDKTRRFYCEVSLPNGQTDEYPHNIYKEESFDIPPEYPSSFYMYLRTNNSGYETSYAIEDEQGNTLYSRSGCSNNTVYRDTFNLAVGCYNLRFMDSGGDGLYFFANNDGTGQCLLKGLNNSTIVLFENDFGSDIFHSFTVGMDLSTNENDILEKSFGVYPNPTSDKFTAVYSFSSQENVVIEVRDLYGKLLETRTINNTKDNSVVFDVSNYKAGIYLCSLITKTGITTQKVMISR